MYVFMSENPRMFNANMQSFYSLQLETLEYISSGIILTSEFGVRHASFSKIALRFAYPESLTVSL